MIGRCWKRRQVERSEVEAGHERLRQCAEIDGGALLEGREPFAGEQLCSGSAEVRVLTYFSGLSQHHPTQARGRHELVQWAESQRGSIMLRGRPGWCALLRRRR